MDFWYRFCRSWFILYYRLYHRARASGAERVPARGAVIVAANHQSFLDPPLVGSFSPRPLFYLARKTLFRNPLAGAILRSWQVVPVDRERGDVAGLKTILELLARGAGVLVFPEGTRSSDRQLQEAQAGFGWLVAKSGALVLPVRVGGTIEAMPRGVAMPRPRRVSVRFGEVMNFDSLIAEARGARGAAAKAIYRRIGEAVMAEIAKLSPCKE